jgi:putative transposase
MEVSEAEEVKHLRDENARLKKLVVDLSLDKDMLQSVIRRAPWARRAEGRSEALEGGEEFHASERHVCGLMEVPRSSCRYQSRRDDSWLRNRLLELAREKPRFGYRRLHVLLGREAIVVNHK